MKTTTEEVLAHFLQLFINRYSDGQDGMDEAMAHGMDDLLFQARIIQHEFLDDLSDEQEEYEGE